MKASKKENKTGFKGWLKNVLTARKAWGIVLRIVILLAIPYAYLMLCGLIFDLWLRMYEMTTFIFYSLMTLYAIALVLIVFSIIWSVKAIKSGEKAPVKKRAEKPAKPVKEEPKKVQVEEPKEVQVEKPIEVQVEEPIEVPAEEPAAEQVNESDNSFSDGIY